MVDFYATLEVHPKATLEEIQNAFKRLAKFGSRNLREAIHGRAQNDSNHKAYETLSDPQQRATYDAELQREKAEKQRRKKNACSVKKRKSTGSVSVLKQRRHRQAAQSKIRCTTAKVRVIRCRNVRPR